MGYWTALVLDQLISGSGPAFLASTAGTVYVTRDPKNYDYTYSVGTVTGLSVTQAAQLLDLIRACPPKELVPMCAPQA